MNTQTIKEHLISFVYMLNPKDISVTQNDEIEDILNILHTYIKYQQFDMDCLSRERDYYRQKLFGE
jgi:hypothetical protein